jgi:hypothetical protein
VCCVVDQAVGCPRHREFQVTTSRLSLHNKRGNPSIYFSSASRFPNAIAEYVRRTLAGTTLLGVTLERQCRREALTSCGLLVLVTAVPAHLLPLDPHGLHVVPEMVSPCPVVSFFSFGEEYVFGLVFSEFNSITSTPLSLSLSEYLACLVTTLILLRNRNNSYLSLVPLSRL